MKRLVVVSHVVHYRHRGRLFAYGPYVREIDVWADLFPEVVIAAPCREEPPRGDCLPYGRENIAIAPVKQTGGRAASAKLMQALAGPQVIFALCRALWRADAIHVRCPGNLGLLGVLLGPLFSRCRVAKYAGQWNGYRGEAWSVRLQRALLRSRWWGGPVTVYGQWPAQPRHVHSFFTSMMTDEQVTEAVRVAEEKRIHSPLRVLFSGRLVPEKRVRALLDAARMAADRGVAFELRIVGDGPQRAELERHASQVGTAGRVTFTGALPYEEGLKAYEWADCLVLPSVHSEGWPKVVAEAMCYGLVCIAVDHGQVGAMLRGRGLVLERGEPREIAEALEAIAGAAAEYQPLARNASLWARQYSLQGLRDALRELLEQNWGVRLRPVADGKLPEAITPTATGILSS